MCVNVHAATSARRSPHTLSEVCLSWLRAVTSHTSVLMLLVKYAFVNFWIFVKKLVMLMLFTTAAVPFHSDGVGKGGKPQLNFIVSKRMTTLPSFKNARVGTGIWEQARPSWGLRLKL